MSDFTYGIIVGLVIGMPIGCVVGLVIMSMMAIQKTDTTKKDRESVMWDCYEDDWK